jgi:hypothetical protein
MCVNYVSPSGAEYTATQQYWISASHTPERLTLNTATWGTRMELKEEKRSLNAVWVGGWGDKLDIIPYFYFLLFCSLSFSLSESHFIYFFT